MNWDDVTAAELDALDAPACGRPDYKGDTESPAAKEACQKQAWEWSIATTCKAASYGAGGDVCEGLAGPIAYVTWPVVKNVLMPLTKAAGDAIFAVLPSAWKAHGVFCGDCLIDEWWWGHTTFDPATDVLRGFIVPWRDATAAVNAAWSKALVVAGLPADTPFRIRSSLLVPIFASERLENHPELLKLAPSKNPGNVLEACEQPPCGPPAFVTDAEQALVLWMDRYWKGTRTIRVRQYGDGRMVANSVRPGRVDQYRQYAPAPWGYGVYGAGPFGLQFYKWPSDCDSGCKQDFAAAVSYCWTYRLEALARALPEVVGAIAVQVAAMRNSKLSMGGRRAPALEGLPVALALSEGEAKSPASPAWLIAGWGLATGSLLYAASRLARRA